MGKKESHKKKVLLGMSGGVDSAVSAILLQEQGYEVYGITLKLWENEGTDIAQEAKKVCDKLGLQHIVLDGKEIFQKHVMEDFICQYKKKT